MTFLKCLLELLEGGSIILTIPIRRLLLFLIFKQKENCKAGFGLSLGELPYFTCKAILWCNGSFSRVHTSLSFKLFFTGGAFLGVWELDHDQKAAGQKFFIKRANRTMCPVNPVYN